MTLLAAILAATSVGRPLPSWAGAEGPSAFARSVDRVAANPNNIAPTVATAPQDNRVYGAPRVAAEHPNTVWDQEDIRRYRKLLDSNLALRTTFEGTKARMDAVIGKPIDIPPPQKGPDGAWLYPGDYFPQFPGTPASYPPLAKFTRYFARDAATVSDLGYVYALTGDEKYAKYGRDLLLAYSNLNRYGPSPVLNYRWNRGLTNQDLEDAQDLAAFARGYDLITNSKSISPEDRRRIHDELLQPLAWVILYPRLVERDPGDTFASQPNNRGAFGSAAVLLAGYATDDEELVRAGLYGVRATVSNPNDAHYKQFPPPKDWVAATRENPSEGLLTSHLASPSVAGGAWMEGSPGYALYALAPLISAAEAAWRHGLDLYSHNDSILKAVFDFPILFSYPDLTYPGENDARRTSLLSIYYPTFYEYGYLRYRDPRYLAIINGAHEGEGRRRRPNADSFSHSWLASTPPPVFDLERRSAQPLTFPSVNFPDVGYGVLRIPDTRGGLSSLTLSYGPSSTSHSHPDKLHLDLWALDDVLMPSPGVQFPYDIPLNAKWHWTTLAHNTLTVDETNQRYTDHPVQKEKVRADQTVYGPAETMGLQRAWSDTAYPGVTMDRSVCLTSAYLADLFAAFSESPHKYDLAWHVRGAPASDLAFAPAPFPEPVANGYSAFTEVRQAPETDASWSVGFDRDDRVARLVAAGGAPTRPILGLGGVYADSEPNGKLMLRTAPTVIQRREGVNSTVFGNVLDLSSAKPGAVKAVSQQGGPDEGFALLRIDAADGVDFCFAAYRPGSHSAPGVQTDALQALVRTKAGATRALYLGGGTFLKAGDASIRRSGEGLAYVETRSEGGFVVGNPSPDSATVTVRLKALAGLQAHEIDSDGKPKAKADAKSDGPGEVTLELAGGSRVAFLPR